MDNPVPEEKPAGTADSDSASTVVNRLVAADTQDIAAVLALAAIAAAAQVALAKEIAGMDFDREFDCAVWVGCAAAGLENFQ